MLRGMNLLIASFVRALGNCLHRKVIAWSLFPLVTVKIVISLV